MNRLGPWESHRFPRGLADVGGSKLPAQNPASILTLKTQLKTFLSPLPSFPFFLLSFSLNFPFLFEVGQVCPQHWMHRDKSVKIPFPLELMVKAREPSITLIKDKSETAEFSFGLYCFSAVTLGKCLTFSEPRFPNR